MTNREVERLFNSFAFTLIFGVLLIVVVALIIFAWLWFGPWSILGYAAAYLAASYTVYRSKVIL